MNLKKPRAIRTAALQSLATQPNHRKVPLAFIGIYSLLFLAVLAITHMLSLKIDNMTGLASMGNRAIFSTISSILSVIPTIFIIGWEMGYLMCALRYARRRYVEPMDLKNGFQKFWPILRAKILMGFVYIGMTLVSIYASAFIFLLLPISNAFVEIMLPLMESATVLNPTILIDEATAYAIVATGWPSCVIFAVVSPIVFLPTYYGFRMVSFCIADSGSKGALIAMSESKAMMKGHKRELFKLDLSFWWFFLLESIISGIFSLDALLSTVGITLPWSSTVSLLVFYVAPLACQVVLYWAFLNRVTVSRAVFYDAIRPQEPAGGVTLGNIFDLAKDYKEYE